jgi:adenylate kinase family enzyme
MEQHTFVFIGRSGSGKGTQAALLMEYLKAQDPDREIFYMETGARFREFMKENTHSAELARQISEKGVLQPEFLAVHMWSHEMVLHMKPNQHLVIDGTPRKEPEARVLHSSFEFYGRKNPHIIHINVSNEWSRERLLQRGRSDDIEKEGVERRLAWFDSDVVPALLWYQENTFYTFIEINGEQTIEEVHAELITAISK